MRFSLTILFISSEFQFSITQVNLRSHFRIINKCLQQSSDKPIKIVVLQVSTISITNNRYLIKKFLRENIIKFSQGITSNCILDVGCGEKPYKEFFPKSRRYIGIDMRSRYADVKSIGEYLPFNDETFDAALCTQVLEHVGDSKKALAEINRVLASNGTLILTTHGIWLEAHEANDYWRWTFQGLEKILEEAGFQIIESYSMDPTSSLLQIISFYIPDRTFIGKIVQAIINSSSRLKINNRPKIYIDHIIKARKRKKAPFFS